VGGQVASKIVVKNPPFMLREHERKIMNVIPAKLSRMVDEVFSAGSLKPDSAVALSRKREVEPFRSKVDGLLPLSKRRSAVLDGTLKLVTAKCVSAK
jgi:hypothetical protein